MVRAWLVMRPPHREGPGGASLATAWATRTPLHAGRASCPLFGARFGSVVHVQLLASVQEESQRGPPETPAEAGDSRGETVGRLSVERCRTPLLESDHFEIRTLPK